MARTMDDRNFDFWQDHSLRYLEMAFHTDKRELRGYPNGFGRHIGQCGATIEMFVKVADNRIEWVSFKADGCLNTYACANTVVSLTEGKHIDHAWEITPDMVVAYLETLPSGDTHCAELAVGAFYRALTNYRENIKTPWKTLSKKNR